MRVWGPGQLWGSQSGPPEDLIHLWPEDPWFLVGGSAVCECHLGTTRNALSSPPQACGTGWGPVLYRVPWGPRPCRSSSPLPRHCPNSSLEGRPFTKFLLTNCLRIVLYFNALQTLQGRKVWFGDRGKDAPYLRQGRAPIPPPEPHQPRPEGQRKSLWVSEWPLGAFLREDPSPPGCAAYGQKRLLSPGEEGCLHRGHTRTHQLQNTDYHKDHRPRVAETHGRSHRAHCCWGTYTWA